MLMKALPPDVERLHRLGFAVHWLKEKSKVPVEAGWTSGERATLEALRKKFKPGLNPGVRLGRASVINGAYLAVIDVDIKSDAKKHRDEATAALLKAFPKCATGPFILSGRGNGSAHYYVLLSEPLAGQEVKARSSEVVKVSMPSAAKASRREVEQLTEAEIKAGVRLRPAWEIALMSEGRQAALAGAVHPDTEKPYVWGKRLKNATDIPLLKPEDLGMPAAVEKPKLSVVPPAEPVAKPSAALLPDVDADELGLRPEQVAAIVDGTGVKDRSAEIYSLCMALVQRGVPREKILSVMTRRDYYLGQCAYDHAKTENRTRAAKWIDRYCLLKAEAKVREDSDVFDVIEELNPKPREKRHAQPPTGVSGKLGGWEDGLEFKFGAKGEPPTVKASYLNIRLILANRCERPDFLSRNTFNLHDTFTCNTPWGSTRGQERSGNSNDALEVKKWLADVYGMEASVMTIDEVLDTVALGNGYHPVKDYLLGLKWDGVERLEKAFETYLGADMPQPYLADVTRKFFLACIRRIFRPGCKFDYVVILEGNQGIGKSSFGDILASEEWFMDSLPNLHDKDSALNLRGAWICELGELAALNKTTNEQVKTFIARRVDRVRPHYGKRREDIPRSTVFLGTTDKNDYLTDTAGNRRWWPVRVHGCDFDALIRDRDQLWAEAMFMHDFCSEPLFLHGRALDQARVIQETRRVEDEGDSMALVLSRWITDQIEDGKCIRDLRLTDLFNNAGPWTSYPTSKGNTMRAGDVLRKAGYIKRHTKNGNVWSVERHG